MDSSNSRNNDPLENSSSIETLYQDFLTEAQFLPGDDSLFDSGQSLDWLDLSLAQSGQDFVHRNIASVGFSHTLALLMGFNFPQLTGVLYKTGKFSSFERALNRFVQTVYHILTWYRSDMVGLYSRGFRDISSVRSTHASIRKSVQQGDDLEDLTSEEISDPMVSKLNVAMESDLKFLDCSVFNELNFTYNPPVHMSQFDMVLTQMGFFLPIYVNRKALGIHDDSGLAGFEHLWALIGHLCGIEDRFNFPIHRPGIAFYQNFSAQIFYPALKHRDERILKIQDNYIVACHKVWFPVPSLPACQYMALSNGSLAANGLYRGTELKKLLSWSDRLLLWATSLTFRLIGCSRLAKWVANGVARLYISKFFTVKSRQQTGTDQEWTMLPDNTKWSEKYKSRNIDVTEKWKKSTASITGLTAGKLMKSENLKEKADVCE